MCKIPCYNVGIRMVKCRMKKHKVFAWLTVLCFLLTIITGYEHQ